MSVMIFVKNSRKYVTFAMFRSEPGKLDSVYDVALAVKQPRQKKKSRKKIFFRSFNDLVGFSFSCEKTF